MSIFKRDFTNTNKQNINEEEHVIPFSAAIFSKSPIASLNLFNLTGSQFIEDYQLRKRAALIFESLSDEFKLLFNCIFWDQARFERFCTHPSSLCGHHSEKYGNLRHTIETCELILKIMDNMSFASGNLALALGLLHDAGKADEYQKRGNKWEMTERGALLGHKETIKEWITIAICQNNIQLEKGHHLGLLHCLSCGVGAPAYLGIREPALQEALILSIADRLSCNESLFMKTISEDYGFGNFHSHLKTRPFVVRGSNEKK